MPRANAQVDPNIRAASWIAWQLAAVWEVYEAKLLQGGVPNAPVPPQRQSGYHTPVLTALLGAKLLAKRHAAMSDMRSR